MLQSIVVVVLTVCEHYVVRAARKEGWKAEVDTIEPTDDTYPYQARRTNKGQPTSHPQQRLDQPSPGIMSTSVLVWN